VNVTFRPSILDFLFFLKKLCIKVVEKKSDDMLYDVAKIPATMVTRKLRLEVFIFKNLFVNLFLTQNN
jgi:hypothetical protein